MIFGLLYPGMGALFSSCAPTSFHICGLSIGSQPHWLGCGTKFFFVCLVYKLWCCLLSLGEVQGAGDAGVVEFLLSLEFAPSLDLINVGLRCGSWIYWLKLIIWRWDSLIDWERKGLEQYYSHAAQKYMPNWIYAELYSKL